MINYKNKIVQKDLENLFNSHLNWEHLRNKTILVTGATGMLASYFSFMLIFLNEKKDFNIKILLLARNKCKVDKIFGSIQFGVEFLIQDVCDRIQVTENIDFIFHAAGGASPYSIINDPVGIVQTNISGTLNILDLAKSKCTKRVVFTSTREVYGRIDNKEFITESDMGVINPLDSRSCYPESKRMAETLLKSYSLQYNVNFNSLRIAHTYGPGMQTENDGRVMADFIGDALKDKDINLNSYGTAERAFCYITDTIDAIFRVLISGVKNEAYNVANEREPIKIIDLAYLIQKIANNLKAVKIIKSANSQLGYTNYKRLKLDTSKIQTLGWQPKISLENGIRKTLQSFR